MSLTITPRELLGGDSTTGTITLDNPAPAGGTVVTIVSSGIDARPPASVSVAAGSTTATVPIPTAGVSGATEVMITASLGAQSRSVQIRLFGEGGSGSGGGGTIGNAPQGSFSFAASIRPFALMAGQAITCTSSTVTGDIGVSPGSAISGFPDLCTNNGNTRSIGDTAVAQGDLVAAYGSLSQPCLAIGGVLDGMTLEPGVYCVGDATSNLAGTLTLSGNGAHILRFGSTFISSAGAQVKLTNGATCGSVAWQVPSSATLEGEIVGNIVAFSSITMNPGTRLFGRALARGAATTLTFSTVNNGSCN